MVTLGPRVLKTGISVTLALYITEWLSLEPPMFAAIAATFTIQPSIYRSWRQVLEQVQANAIGALIALVSIYLFGHNPFIIGLVMVIVILVCLKFNMAGTISLTLVTVVVMMSQPAYTGLLAAADKFLIVLVGMGSAFFVNILISPPNYKKNFFTLEQEALRGISLLLRTAISDELTEKSFQQQWRKVKQDLSRLEDLYKLLDEERENISKIKPLDVREIVVMKQRLECLQLGLKLLDKIEEHFFQSGPTSEEREMFDQYIEKLTMQHEMALLKFEGKIKYDLDPDHDLIQESSLFLENVVHTNQTEKGLRVRLIVIASALYEYAFQMQRLNDLTEIFLRKKKISEQTREKRRWRK
ncbi:aromatic acid exporter family protein [Mesobacillus foraminis]|uniref:FUSC family protein n=1 Tax=Mesobacillus foraminis TaxID=279826 RepID=UPI001BEB7CBF|nr:aromatic acid exporter family protein [Mesobacillus foraminis]MBT2755364.1 aromatic acid exporter family protein [Mesobacillus foraminis]